MQPNMFSSKIKTRLVQHNTGFSMQAHTLVSAVVKESRNYDVNIIL